MSLLLDLLGDGFHSFMCSGVFSCYSSLLLFLGGGLSSVSITIVLCTMMPLFGASVNFLVVFSLNFLSTVSA